MRRSAPQQSLFDAIASFGDLREAARREEQNSRYRAPSNSGYSSQSYIPMAYPAPPVPPAYYPEPQAYYPEPQFNVGIREDSQKNKPVILKAKYYPKPKAQQSAQQVHPAIREAAQQKRPKYKGQRKVYIDLGPEISGAKFFNKKELEEYIAKYENLRRKGQEENTKYYSNPDLKNSSREKLEKELARNRFQLMHKYNLGKHEPDDDHFNEHDLKYIRKGNVLDDDHAPEGQFGSSGKSHDFYEGFYSKNGQKKGWGDMNEDEQDKFMAQQNALKALKKNPEAQQSAPQVNPAIREAVPQKRPEYKGQRKVKIKDFINTEYLNKKELEEYIADKENRARTDRANTAKIYQQPYPDDASWQELEKKLARDRFDLMHQYKIGKHEPAGWYGGGLDKKGRQIDEHDLQYVLKGNHDGQGGSFGTKGASDFFLYGKSGLPGPSTGKGWNWMDDNEKDSFIARQNAFRASNKSSEKLVREQEKAKEAQLRLAEIHEQARKNTSVQDQERAQKMEQEKKQEQEREMERRAQEQVAQFAALPPAQKQQIIYNKQLAEYNEAVERNQYMDMMQQQQQQQPQQFDNQFGGSEMSPVMLHDLMSGIQNEQTRYVPMQRKRSIHNSIMNSFDPNMFSPEFIPEEDYGY